MWEFGIYQELRVAGMHWAGSAQAWVCQKLHDFAISGYWGPVRAHFPNHFGEVWREGMPMTLVWFTLVSCDGAEGIV